MKESNVDMSKMEIQKRKTFKISEIIPQKNIIIGSYKMCAKRRFYGFLESKKGIFVKRWL